MSAAALRGERGMMSARAGAFERVSSRERAMNHASTPPASAQEARREER